MTNLKQVNNQDFLNELRERIQANQLNQGEISQLLEKEAWKKGYKEAAQDEKRWSEAKDWEVAQMSDWVKRENERTDN